MSIASLERDSFHDCSHFNLWNRRYPSILIHFDCCYAFVLIHIFGDKMYYETYTLGSNRCFKVKWWRYNVYTDYTIYVHVYVLNNREGVENLQLKKSSPARWITKFSALVESQSYTLASCIYCNNSFCILNVKQSRLTPKHLKIGQKITSNKRNSSIRQWW